MNDCGAALRAMILKFDDVVAEMPAHLPVDLHNLLLVRHTLLYRSFKIRRRRRHLNYSLFIIIFSLFTKKMSPPPSLNRHI